MVRFFDRKKIVRRLLLAEKVPPLPTTNRQNIRVALSPPFPPHRASAPAVHMQQMKKHSLHREATCGGAGGGRQESGSQIGKGGALPSLRCVLFTYFASMPRNAANRRLLQASVPTWSTLRTTPKKCSCVMCPRSYVITPSCRTAPTRPRLWICASLRSCARLQKPRGCRPSAPLQATVSASA